MSKKGRRYSLRPRDAKETIRQASEILKIDLDRLVGAKSNIEVFELEENRIFLVDGKPILFKTGELILPTLVFSAVLAKMSRIIVDMGAVPYVCKGADVMAPGIVRIEGEFNNGDFIVVADVKHGKVLSIGESLSDSATARTTKKGPVVKNYHFVGDKIWEIAKNLMGA